MSGAWITGPKLTQERGYSPGQIRGRVQRKYWRIGIEYADVDGARLFDIEAIDTRASELAAVQRQPDRRRTQRPRQVVPLVSGGRIARLK